MNGLRYTHVESPVGDLLVAGTEEALHFLSFPTGHKAFRPRPEWRRDDAPFQEVRRQLDAYFAGDLRRFELALHLSGTEFQNSVWGIARSVGRPKASRAVGAANGSNPLPIILPCHRVIGAGGSLTGFGGGLAVKAFLLRHEGVLV